MRLNKFQNEIWNEINNQYEKYQTPNFLHSATECWEMETGKMSLMTSDLNVMLLITYILQNNQIPCLCKPTQH